VRPVPAGMERTGALHARLGRRCSVTAVLPLERRPRIVYIVTSDTSADVLLRGQLSYLARQGFEVAVICGTGERLAAVSAREGVPCHGIDLARELAPLRDLRASFQLLGLLHRLQPDIVNASTPKAALLGLCAAWLTRVPHRVYLLRGLRLETLGRAGRAGMRSIERLCAALSECVVCVSPSLAQRYLEEGLAPAAKCRVLGTGSSNGTDSARFTRSAELEAKAEQLGRELGLLPGFPTLGFVGRPVADKGIADLLEVYRCMRDERSDTQLLIVGAGFAGDAECAEMAELRAMPGVFVVPAAAEVAPYYCLMNVLVFPSYREGFPNVVLEASCAGVPVVGFEATGVRDAIVHGVTGRLCRLHDTAALVAATRAYLADPELARRHGAAGAKRVRREFESEHVWAQTLALYRELLERC
jgi:glycosyltransferase involved in cell wall biosynthesis